MLFLHNLYDDSTWDVSKYILSLCGCVLSSVKFLPRPVKDLGAYLRGRNKTTSNKTTSGVVCSADAEETFREAKETSGVVCYEKVKNSTANAEATPEVVSTPEAASTAGHANPVVLQVLIGFGISLPLLAVVLPLLLSSDVIFQGFFKNMFDFSLEIDPGAVLFMMIVVFVASYIMLCRFGQPMKFAAAPVTDKRRYSPVIAITVNVVLLNVYLLYCGIQVIYLFLRQGTLPEGYTYSGYAHEGFFQLVFVCLINIVLVLICRKYSADNLVLKSLLCLISGCTYVMIASAAYRMYLYIGAYKLTFLRLYVLLYLRDDRIRGISDVSVYWCL